MNRTQKFAINTFTSVLQQIVVMLVGFITPRIMLEYYGSEVNGLITSLTQFFSYFSLVEAGLASASIYALYKPLADNDTVTTNSVLSATKRFYTKSGVVFLLLTIALAISYPLYVKTNALQSQEIVFLVFVLGFSGCLDFFTLSKYRSLLTADQKLYVINIANLTHNVVNTVIVVIMAQCNASVLVLKAVALLSIVLRSVILVFYCRKNYNYLDFSVEPNYEALNKRWDALVLQVLGAIHTGAPVMIITLILKDLNAASIYSVYSLVTIGIGGVVGVFTNGLSSAFGEIIAENKEDTLRKSHREFECAYYCLIAILYTVSFVMINSFIKLYTAGIEDVEYSIPLFGFLVVLDGLLYNIKTPQGMLIISAGHFKETRYQVIMQGLIAVVGGAVLAMHFGLYGVVLGSVLSNLYRDIDLLFYVPKKITKASWKITAKHMGIVIMVPVIIVLISTMVDMKIRNYFGWCLWAVIVTIFSSVVTLALMWLVDKEAFMGIVYRIKQLLVKFRR